MIFQTNIQERNSEENNDIVESKSKRHFIFQEHIINTQKPKIHLNCLNRGE